MVYTSSARLSACVYAYMHACMQGMHPLFFPTRVADHTCFSPRIAPGGSDVNKNMRARACASAHIQP